MNEIVRIKNHDVVVREHGGARVCTFNDIDVLHERPIGTAGRNFRENRTRLKEGEDYFRRNSSEAKTEHGITAPNGLVLLTESGYLMLTKSMTDDLSWEIQRMLVDTYFRKPKPADIQLGQLAEMATSMASMMKDMMTEMRRTTVAPTPAPKPIPAYRQTKRQYIESVVTPERFDDAMWHLLSLATNPPKGIWRYPNSADFHEDAFVRELMVVHHPIAAVFLERENIPRVADMMAGHSKYMLKKKDILGKRCWHIECMEDNGTAPATTTPDDGTEKVRRALEEKPGPLGKILKALGYEVSSFKVAQVLIQTGVYQRKECAMQKSLYKPGSDRAIQYFFTARALPYIIAAAERVKAQEDQLW